MIPGTSVRPQKWKNVIDLYDDGAYSAIWGNFDGSKDRCLGVRWNGKKDERGYPSQGRNPLWYVEPDFSTKEILSILSKIIHKNNLQHQIDFKKNISIAFAEIKARQNPDVNGEVE